MPLLKQQNYANILNVEDTEGAIVFAEIDEKLISNWIKSSGIRPVTSFKSCVQWKSRNGSAENPYEIVENGGC